jgi:hypothetical protein
MAITEAFAGSAAIAATEWSLTTNAAGVATETSDGVYQVWLDVADMVAGDELQVRLYEKVRASDPQRLLLAATLVGPQAPPVWVSPSLILLHGWDVTLLGVSGTMTTTWSIRKVA